MRDPRPPVPERADAAVCLYRDLIDDALPGRLVGLHLVGSIALDDFQPGRSDVDFVAVLDTPADDDTLDALERVHDEIDASSDLPKVDGVYVTADAFGGKPERANPCPFHVNGRFARTGTCFELNPVTWATLSRHGVTLRGSPAGELGISVSHPRLAEWCSENLRGYWSDYAASARALLGDLDPRAELPAELLTWAVTGPLRLHFTIATGEVTSKTGAARWAEDDYGASWHDLLHTALAARGGKVETTTVAAAGAVPDFIDTVVAHATARRAL